MSEKETWQKMGKEERLRHQLEVQSRQIERVFSTHQVAARVAGGRCRRSPFALICSPTWNQAFTACAA
jgi:hypothetical protein